MITAQIRQPNLALQWQLVDQSQNQNVQTCDEITKNKFQAAVPLQYYSIAVPAVIKKTRQKVIPSNFVKVE